MFFIRDTPVARTATTFKRPGFAAVRFATAACGGAAPAYTCAMADRVGQIAVIFLSRRTGADDAGYAEAAERMERLAAEQPGFRGVDSARSADGAGITVSWWADEASALAWRAHADHAAVRAGGRAGWYESYEVAVAGVHRSYRWSER